MKRAAKKSKGTKTTSVREKPRMNLIPCSCGTTFAVSENYDGQGMHLRSFLPCPKCGKMHDPRNRVLRIGYQEEQFWKVDGC